MSRIILVLLALLVAGALQAQAPNANDPYQGVPAPTIPRRPPIPPPRPQPAPAPVTSVPGTLVPSPGYPVAVGQSFRDCQDCPEMVVVPPGNFLMGSPEGEKWGDARERPQRRVRLHDALAIGKYHVMVGEYRTFVQATGRVHDDRCRRWDGSESTDERGRSPHFAQTDRDPAVCVSWEDARAYAAWVSQRSGQRYRLPTEAEWEYAARAGTASRWWWGEDSAAQCKAANGIDQSASREWATTNFYMSAPCDDGYAYTGPVGRFAPNRFGLHGMAGNALQWTLDCYHDSYKDAPLDASTPVEGTPCEDRVLRGGSWFSSPAGLRSAFRYNLSPRIWIYYAGFRVVRTSGS